MLVLKGRFAKKKSWVDWIGLTGRYRCYHYSKDSSKAQAFPGFFFSGKGKRSVCLCDTLWKSSVKQGDKWQCRPLKLVSLFTPAWWLFFAQKFKFIYSGENVLFLDCVPGWALLFLRNDLSELCFSGWREGFASKVKLVCSLFRALQVLLQTGGRKDQKKTKQHCGPRFCLFLPNLLI